MKARVWKYGSTARIRQIRTTIAGLQVTSRQPCWWSRTKAFLSAGKWTLFWCKFGRKISFVLTTNMAALSRGCNQEYHRWSMIIPGELDKAIFFFITVLLRSRSWNHGWFCCFHRVLLFLERSVETRKAFSIFFLSQWYFCLLLTESVQDSLNEATTPKSRVNLDVQRIPEGIVALWLRTGNSCGPSLLLYIDLFWKKRTPPPPPAYLHLATLKWMIGWIGR